MEFMTVQEINEKLILLVRNERKLSQEILNHIILFQKCAGHLKLGYSSMHQYLTRGLGYSDDQAYRRLKAAQLMVQVPEVAPKLESGQLNLSQAAETQKAFETAQKEQNTPISHEKKKTIIEAIEKANNHQTKNILASELNLKPEVEERIKPQSNKTVRIEMNLTEAQFEKLKQIKGLLSHQVPDQNTSVVLEKLFDFYLEKKVGAISKENSSHQASIKKNVKVNKVASKKSEDSTPCFLESRKRSVRESISKVDPFGKIEKFDSQIKSDTKSEVHFKTQSNQIHTSLKRNRYIAVSVKKALYQRSQGCCEYRNKEGVRCQSRYQIEIEHCQPFSKGGSNSLENLKIFCRQHNALAATESGIGWETQIIGK